MKQLIPLLAFALGLSAQTVSNITFDGVGDSSARAIFNVSSTFNTMRVRYGTSSCSGGSGGTVQTNGTSPGSYTLFGMTANVSGLAPSTLYHVCPEVSNTGGASWSNGTEATFTTLARAQTLPTAPVSVSTTFPAQSGTVRNVMSDCSDLQTQINSAVPGDTVVIPAGTICTGIYTLPTAPDAISFLPSAVRTSDSRITVASGGFTENQSVMLSTDGCLPGMQIYPYGVNCDKSGGWRKGGRYYVHIVDGSHVQLLNAPSGSPVVPGWIPFTANTGASTMTYVPTFQTPSGYAGQGGGASVPANLKVQFASTGTLPAPLTVNTDYFLLTSCAASPNAVCTTQISATSGGGAITLTTTGTGTHTIVDQGSGNLYIAPAPTQAGPWVLIKTGGTLPPAGVRIDPTWDSQVAILRNNTLLPAAGYTTPRLTTGILSHNWHVQGIKFDTGTNTDYLTTVDPRPYCLGPFTGQDSSFIVFDQIRIQGPGAPNRTGCQQGGFSGMDLDGYNIGIINSHLSGLDFWYTWVDPIWNGSTGGFVPTRVSGSQVTATAGTCHAYTGASGNALASTSGTLTVNFTGGGNGTAYASCLLDGTISVVAPAGTGGNCSVNGAACNFKTSASPGYPIVSIGGGNRAAGIQLFTVTLSAGSVTAVALGDPNTANGPPQSLNGANAIIAGNGPGPYIYSNNYQSGTGLTLHFDDGGGPLLPRGDYTITRNYFNVPASQNATQPGSDGLRYNNRQPIEWKGGQRIKIDGNTFDGCFNEISGTGACTVFTPRSGGYITDVSITNNSYINSAGGTLTLAPIDSYAPVSKPGARMYIYNNLFLLNGWLHFIKGYASPRGWMAYGGYAEEDITIDHNTVYDNRGSIPAFLYWVLHPAGGISITNNIYFYTGNWPMIASENIANCAGLTDKAMMDCAFTAGPGRPSYAFKGNIVIPSWSDTSVPRGFVGKAAVTAALGSLADSNFVPAGASAAANVPLVNFNGNYTLNAASLYYAACSGGTTCGYSITAPPLASTPSINGVLNGASFATGPVAPGEIVVIQGTSLGPASPVVLTLAPDGKVSTSLGGVSVLFNGIAAPLLYVSDSQINAVVPYEIAGAVDLSVVVTFQGQTSNAYPLDLALTNPALFTLDGSGTGPAAILNEDNSRNTPLNAASKGSQVVIYLTGEGQTTPPGVTGQITTVSPTLPVTPQPLLPVLTFISGTQAPTLFYGEAPGIVGGLMQLNVQIPGTVPSGNLPITVSVGDKASQPGISVSVQ